MGGRRAGDGVVLAGPGLLCVPCSPAIPDEADAATHTRPPHPLPHPTPPPQLCMATVYSLLYGSLGRKITGEAKAV